MRVVIRADASPSIGVGHVARCLALAQALRDAGDEVVLASVDPAPTTIEAWHSEGATIELLQPAAGTADDADATAATVRAADARWLCIDGYHFDASFRRRARASSQVLVVDDHGLPPIDADVDAVVNGNLYADDRLYPNTESRLLLGPRYALLRREFVERRADGDHSHGVLVSLGGADPGRRTEPLLQALTELGVRGRVVIGPYNVSAEALRRRAASLGWQTINSPPDMSQLIASSDVVVMGAGSGALEALAVGTPLVAVRIADNQAPVVDALRRLDLAATADGSAPIDTAASVVALLGDDERRESFGRRGRDMVDARGAARVAAEMRGQALTIRPAIVDDGALLLAWRNDAATRAASFESATVEPAAHMAWLAASLRSASRVLLIGMLDGRPVGVVRLDQEEDRAVISVTVAPAERGRGLAKPLIRLALLAARERGIAEVFAHLRPDNAASGRAFAAAGFARVERGEVRAPIAGATTMIALTRGAG